MMTFKLTWEHTGEVIEVFHSVEEGTKAMLRWGIEHPYETDLVFLDSDYGEGELIWVEDSLVAVFDFSMVDEDLDDF